MSLVARVPTDRRRLVHLALATLAVLAVVAVAALLLGGTQAGPPALDAVPADVDAVVLVDGSLLTDGASRHLLVSVAGATGAVSNASETLDRTISHAESVGLDPADVDHVVLFSRLPPGGIRPGPDTGAVIYADWEVEALVGQLERLSGATYTAESTDTGTVYRPTGNADLQDVISVGVIDEGAYVVGPEWIVADAMAVANGDRPAFGGEMRRTLLATREGRLRFVVNAPGSRLVRGGSPGLDLVRYRAITHVAGSFDTDGDRVRLEFRLRVNSSEAASDVHDVTGGLLAIAAGRLENGTAVETVRAVDLHREGQTIVITTNTTVDRVERLIVAYASGGS